MSIYYEWVVETTMTQDTPENACGEVIDFVGCTSYADAWARFCNTEPDCLTAPVIVLVRSTSDGDRSWAYMKDGRVLPHCFVDAYGQDAEMVPVRFHNEVARELGS